MPKFCDDAEPAPRFICACCFETISERAAVEYCDMCEPCYDKARDEANEEDAEYEPEMECRNCSEIEPLDESFLCASCARKYDGIDDAMEGRR